MLPSTRSILFVAALFIAQALGTVPDGQGLLSSFYFRDKATASHRGLATCVPETAELQGTILVELDGNPSEVTSSEMNQIGDTLLQTYNEAVSCARQLTGFAVKGPTSYGDVAAEFVLEYELIGTCAECSSESTLFDYVNYVFLGDDDCPCKGPWNGLFDVLLGRVGLESDAHITAVWELQDLTCPAAATPFESSAIVQFRGCPSQLTQQVVNDMAQQFMDAYNYFNSLPTPTCDRFFRQVTSVAGVFDPNEMQVNMGRRRTEEEEAGNDAAEFWASYDPANAADNIVDVSELAREYRHNDDFVQGSLNGDYDAADATDDIVDCLQGLVNGDYDATDATDNVGDCIELMREYSIDDGFVQGLINGDYDGGELRFDPYTYSGDFTSHEHTKVPFDDCSSIIEIRFDIQAICRGCSPGATTLFDDPSDVFDQRDNRRLSKHHPTANHANVFEEHDSMRNLQSSECRCPVDSGYRALTEDEMIINFDYSLYELTDNNDNPLDLTVDGIIEIKEVQCAPTVNHFDTNIELKFDSDEETLSEDTQTAFVNSFLASYNNLSQRFCDPLFRHAQRADWEVQRVSNPKRRLQIGHVGNKNTTGFTFSFNFIFIFRLSIVGNCRFCPPRTPLFGNDAIKRRLSPHGKGNRTIDDTRSRRLVAGEQCFCSAVNVVNGAPSEREVIAAYQQELERLITAGTVADQFSLSAVHEDSIAPTPPPASTRSPVPLPQSVPPPSLVSHPSAAPSYAGTVWSTYMSPSSPTLASPEIHTYHHFVCHSDRDCMNSETGEICVANQCLDSGSPRIMLVWFGDDDLDLSVITPHGEEINWDQRFDPASGGRFDTTFVQEMYQDHVESIVFPLDDSAAGGEYSIRVRSFEPRGAADPWTVQVFGADNKMIDSIAGLGEALDMVYERQDAVIPSAEECSTSSEVTECCEDDDCVNSGAQCLNQQCASTGDLMFTLSYFGNDDYELTVITPANGQIHVDRPFDQQSGGSYEGDRNALFVDISTRHTEHIWFANALPGEYIFLVEPSQIRGIPDTWDVEVTDTVADKKKVYQGSGFPSPFITYIH